MIFESLYNKLIFLISQYVYFLPQEDAQNFRGVDFHLLNTYPLEMYFCLLRNSDLCLTMQQINGLSAVKYSAMLATFKETELSMTIVLTVILFQLAFVSFEMRPI